MKNSFTLGATFPVSQAVLYKAWLSGEEHTKFTGNAAKINPKLNGKFTAWDGYISGKNIELLPDRKIVQSWRTTEFPDGSPDSTVEILFEKRGTGTKLTVRHSGIPFGQADGYKQGWKDYYFKPMKVYFSKKHR
jgi:activator of HSP90 ATPase